MSTVRTCMKRQHPTGENVHFPKHNGQTNIAVRIKDYRDKC